MQVASAAEADFKVFMVGPLKDKEAWPVSLVLYLLDLASFVTVCQNRPYVSKSVISARKMTLLQIQNPI